MLYDHRRTLRGVDAAFTHVHAVRSVRAQTHSQGNGIIRVQSLDQGQAGTESWPCPVLVCDLEQVT